MAETPSKLGHVGVRRSSHCLYQATYSTEPCNARKASSQEAVVLYLKSVVCLIVEQGLGKTRASILTKQLSRHGGICARKVDANTTHILVGNTIRLEKLSKILNVRENKILDNVEIVRADWLSSCLKEGRLVEVFPFSLRKKRGEQLVTTDQGQNNLTTVQRCPNTEKPNTSHDGEEREEANPPDDCLFSRKGDEEEVSRKRKLDVCRKESSDSDYVNSDDEKTDELSEDSVTEECKEISPHISPHKKVCIVSVQIHILMQVHILKSISF